MVTSIEVTVVTWIKVNHRFEAQFTSIEVTRGVKVVKGADTFSVDNT